MMFKTEDNLERQRLVREFDKKIKNYLKKPRKIRIRDLIPRFGVGVFNKGGIVAKTKSKFKGQY